MIFFVSTFVFSQLSFIFLLKFFSVSVPSFPAIPLYSELILFLACVLDLYLSS